MNALRIRTLCLLTLILLAAPSCDNASVNQTPESAKEVPALQTNRAQAAPEDSDDPAKDDAAKHDAAEHDAAKHDAAEQRPDGSSSVAAPSDAVRKPPATTVVEVKPPFELVPGKPLPGVQHYFHTIENRMADNMAETDPIRISLVETGDWQFEIRPVGVPKIKLKAIAGKQVGYAVMFDYFWIDQPFEILNPEHVVVYSYPKQDAIGQKRKPFEFPEVAAPDIPGFEEPMALPGLGPEEPTTDLKKAKDPAAEERKPRRIVSKATPEQKAQSKLNMAKQMLQKGKESKAHEWLRQIIADYPESEAAKEAGRILKRD